MSFQEHDLETHHNDLVYDTYRYKLMIVDDSAIARRLIKKHAHDINANVVCEATSADEAYNKYIEFEPDVVTMDISMPGESGIVAVRKIINFDPSAKILMVTSHGEEEMVIDALESGAKGFILKPVTKQKLEEQFNKVKNDPYKMFRSVHYFPSINEKIKKELYSFTKKSEYVIFLAEKSKPLIPTLRDLPFDCVGGVFPEVIFDAKVHQEGFVIMELSKEANYKFIKHMGEPIDHSMKQVLQNKKSALVFADAFSESLEPFLENLSQMVPPNLEVIGCGTGGSDMKHTPSLFTPKGIYEDGAIVFYSHESIDLGLADSWKKLAGPFEVTKSAPNTLFEVDDEDNFLELYEEILKSEKGITIVDGSFFEEAKKYPLGVKKQKLTLIREVVRKNAEGIFALGNFDLHSLVYVMENDIEDISKAPQKALEGGLINIEDKTPLMGLIFEGIGRKDQLVEQTIQKDLDIIKKELKNIPQCGAVSLLELCNKNSKKIEIHNSSIALAIIN